MSLRRPRQTEPVTDERRLVMAALSELKPHPNNARRHQRKGIQESYGELGYGDPILVCERTGYIAAGHGRRATLIEMKGKGADPPEGVTTDEAGEWYVPTIRGWASRDDDELRAYLIADNGRPGEWEMPELTTMLTELRETEPGLTATGFSTKELDKMLAPAAETKTVGSENSYDQRADNYRNKQVRSIILDYPLTDYEFVTTTAKRACGDFHAETFAELFVAMLMAFEATHEREPA